MNQSALDHDRTKNGHHTISTFLESFENQVKRDVSTEKPITRNNLTLNEIKALKDLQNETILLSSTPIREER